MIKFLINRPIAVNMVYIALLLLGMVALRYFPVSLLPATDIPEITLNASAPDMSARMVQNNVTLPLINQLRQVKHLESIESQSRNNQSFIRLRFTPGTKINLAFIEAGEKLDAAMPYLPRQLPRPQITKARLTDIPAFYLALSYQQGQDMLKFSEFIRSVLKPRLEQLPTVALADASGLENPEIAVIPQLDKLKILGITIDDIKNTIVQNNLEISNILLHQYQYEYYLKIDNRLTTINDIKKLLIAKNSRFYRLDQVAEIRLQAQQEQGRFYFGKQRAVAMAIIKNSDAQMSELKKQVKELYQHFQKDYPQLQFHLYRNQTALLDFAISNLAQSLLIGLILAILITWLFLRHWRYALLIGVTIPVSLIISFLFLWTIGVSINIVSLSGLILAVGMMIDNAIIVVENIGQQTQKGDKAIVEGVQQIIVPLLSSMLTTLAVFIPLIFIGGITQVLFFDQAVTIASGLFASFAVSVTFLPVWYKKLALQNIPSNQPDDIWHRWYKKWHHKTFEYRKTTLFIMFLLIVAGIFFAADIHKSLMPTVSYHDAIVNIKWNENISLDENYKRYEKITALTPQKEIKEKTLLAGIPQFTIAKKNVAGFYESQIYLNFISTKALNSFKQKAIHYIQSRFPLAEIKFHPSDNLFNQVFKDKRPPLRIQIFPANLTQEPDLHLINKTIAQLNKNPHIHISLPLEESFELQINADNLQYFGVPSSLLYAKLKTLFGVNQAGELRNFQRQIPIRLSHNQKTLYQIINKEFVLNKNGQAIPLNALVKVKKINRLKVIHASDKGEYIPLDLHIAEQDLERVKHHITKILNSNNKIRWQLSGKLLQSGEILRKGLFLLLVSLALLYVILSATFDSPVLSLIILIELPIDLSGIFIALWLGGEGLNMMSIIGIIVTAGIVINDSILKIDTINRLLKNGLPLEKAIEQGGKLRVNAILMTSLTTIFALVPMLFESGLGVELQLPLTLSVIGGLGLGTLVSLFGIPLIYYYLKRNRL